VGRAVSRIIPVKNRLDSTGRDQQDYTQLLWLKGLEAGWHFKQTRGKKQQSEKGRFVSTSIINQVRSLIRELRKSPEFVGYDESHDKIDNFELRFMQRDLLERIQVILTKSDWQILVCYADSDRNAREAWRLYGQSITERGYRKQVTRARLNALRAWKKISKK